MSQVDLVHPGVHGFRTARGAHHMIIRCRIVIDATDDNLLAEQSMLLRDGLIERFGEPSRDAAIEICRFYEHEYRSIYQAERKHVSIDTDDQYWRRSRAAAGLRKQLEVA